MPYIWAAAYTAFGGYKNNNFGAPQATPNGFKNLTRFKRIPNMYLVLKLDNEKVVSIANGQNHRQNHRQTESPNHPVPD